VVGFTAFLAGLTDFGGGNGGGSGGRGGGTNWDEVMYFPQSAWHWLQDNPHWFLLILIGVFLLFLLMVLLTWLSSRGKFMFLDNVVHDRAQVAKPWYDYRHQGNSLFLWSFFVGLLFFAAIVVYLVFSYSVLLGIYEYTWEPVELIGPAILLGLGFFAIIMFGVFLDLLLVDFVVPLMYKSQIRVLAGWRAFLSLFGRYMLYFLGYALFMVGLSILIAIIVIAAVIFTCCIGLIFLIIPYISSVALLPITYTMRAFSVEFLGQFGPEYQLFPGTGSNESRGGVVTT
ncbi:MAG: hypothetical protein WBG80_04970, partial [Bacteroidota bacterium]